MRRKRKDQMKRTFARAGVFVFFATVIIVSLVLIKKGDPDSVETVNTMPEEYHTQTDVISGPEETDVRYGHDIEFEEYPEEETETEVLPEETADYPEAPEEAAEEAAETTVTSVSRTIITSRQRKDYDSNSVYIDMENILQNPELPVGCEITALTTLLRHYGFDAEKTDMAKNYLPTSWGNARTADGKLYKDSFFDYFIGDQIGRAHV